MLLAVDVGNTQTVLGLFDGEDLRQEWRLTTQPQRTADEVDVDLAAVLERRGVRDGAVTAGVLSSTVPTLVEPWSTALARRAGRAPVVIGPGVRTGLAVRTDNPREVGPDRIANAVAAFALHGGPCIVVDFGTSTNFDVVSSDGEFVGGAIAPGVEISMDALYQRAARLVRVELAEPASAIGRSTVAAMQSGAVFGFAGQVDGIVGRIQRELGAPCPVVATGGLARLIRPHCTTITAHEPWLTLIGLRIVWERASAGV
jgi:type III pantothenate kinase